MTQAPSFRSGIPFWFLATAMAGGLLAFACGAKEDEDPCAPNGQRMGQACLCNAGHVPSGSSCVPKSGSDVIEDAGSTDAGGFDAGSPDAGSPDAGSPDAGSPDAATTADAGVPCGVPDPLDASKVFESSAIELGGEFLYYAIINEDPHPDDVSVELFPGYGVFASGLAPGTYSLTGAELQYKTCGLCVLLNANMDPQNNFRPAQMYLATGGTVELTSVTGRLTGTLSNVTFERVTLSNQVSTPTGDCVTRLTSFSFDVPIQK